MQKHREQHNNEARIDVNGSFVYAYARLKPFGLAQNLSDEFATKSEQGRSNDQQRDKSKPKLQDPNDDCSFSQKRNLVNVTNEVSKATEALIYMSDDDGDDDFNVENLFPRDDDWMNSTEAFDLTTSKPTRDDNVEKTKQGNDTFKHDSTILWTSMRKPTELNRSSEILENVIGTQMTQNETEILTKRQIKLNEQSVSNNHKMKTKTGESAETCQETRYECDDSDVNDGYYSENTINWNPEAGSVEETFEFTDDESDDESKNVQNETKSGKSNMKSKEHRKKKKYKKDKTNNKAMETRRDESIKEDYKNNTEGSDSDSEGSTAFTDTIKIPEKPERQNRKMSTDTKKPLLYQCPQCKQFFSYKNHDEERECHECPHCQAVSTNLVDFRTEMRNKNREGSFRCTVCCKEISGGMQYVRHAWIHSNIKQHQCEYCYKSFVDKSKRDIHQMTHSSTKPYQCAICGKGLRTKCGLDVHARSHTGEKPYECVPCSAAFKDKCKFQNHIFYSTINGGSGRFGGGVGGCGQILAPTHKLAWYSYQLSLGGARGGGARPKLTSNSH